MKPEQLELIMNSLIQPQGLFSIYDAGDIGKDPDSRIAELESLKYYRDLGGHFALEMKYAIGGESVYFQFLATSSTSFPYAFDWKTKKAKTWRSPKVIAELGDFSYEHKETIQLGNRMLQGENVGPLEHEILKECLEKDPEHAKVRQQTGYHFVAVGEFAQRVSLNGLDVNANLEILPYARLKRTG